MYGPVAAEQRTQFRRRQRRDLRQLAEPDEPGLLGRAAIRRLHQEADTTGPQPLLRRLPTADGLPRAPREADKVTDAPPQAILDRRAKVGGHMRLATGCLRKGPAARGPFYHIGPRAQPHSPPRQTFRKVGHDLAIRAEHEADHRLLR